MERAGTRAVFWGKAVRAHAEQTRRAKNECWHAASPKAVETAAVLEIGSVFIFSALRTAQPQFPAVCMRMHPPPPYSAFLITPKRKIGICKRANAAPFHYRGRRSFPFLLAKPLLFALLITQRALLSSLARNLRNQAKLPCLILRKAYHFCMKLLC